MNIRRLVLCSACSFAALFAAGCGSSGIGGGESGDGGLSDNAGNALTGNAGSMSMGGAAGVSTGGTAAGLAGSESLGPGGTGGTEAAGGTEASGGSEADMDDDPLAVPSPCPAIHADPVSGQTWALLVVNVVDDYLVFQNITNQPQEMSTDYQWCAVPIYERVIDLAPNGARRTQTVPPGGILRVDTLIPQGGLDLERIAGEMGLYPAPGTYRNPEDIQLFVSWGEGNPTDGRESVAVAAGIWSFGDRVRIIYGDAGFVATGATDSSEGFTSVPRPCMPLLPETLE